MAEHPLIGTFFSIILGLSRVLLLVPSTLAGGGGGGGGLGGGVSGTAWLPTIGSNPGLVFRFTFKELKDSCFDA